MIGNPDGLLKYAVDNGYDIQAGAATNRALRQVNLFFMGLKWRGEAEDPSQIDIFPRKIDGKVVPLPDKVLSCCYLVACEIIDSGQELNITGMTQGAKVLQEQVDGAVTVSYSEASLYNEGFNASFLGAMLNDWLTEPASASRSANIKVGRG